MTDDKAREARYAEALLTDPKAGASKGMVLLCNAAIITAGLASAEIEKVRSQRDEKWEEVKALADQVADTRRRAETAEAERDQLRAALTALADEWAKQDPAYWHMLHEPDVKRAIEAAQFALAEDIAAALARVGAADAAPESGEGR